MRSVSALPLCLLVAATLSGCGSVVTTEQRNAVSFLRGRYNTALYRRHNQAFRVGAALHFAHAKQHDVLWLTALEKHGVEDAEFDREATEFTVELKARTEPSQEQYAQIGRAHV